jgi:hypothetical protein
MDAVPEALPADVVEQLVEETRNMALGLFGFEPPPSAEVFGPASYFEIFAASAPESVGLNEDAEDGWPYYLVVLRGRFLHRQWGPGAPPRAIATLLWSQTTEARQFSLRHDLPEAMSDLAAPHTISLAASSVRGDAGSGR